MSEDETEKEETQEQTGESTEEEEEKSQKLLERAFRWPKLGVAERLVTQRLVLATLSSDANIIITHITAASAMVEALKQPVEGLDYELMKGIYAVNKSFVNNQEVKLDRWGSLMYKIAWAFKETEENYLKLIKPWKVNTTYYSNYIVVHRRPLIKIIHNSYSCHETISIVEPQEKEQAIQEIAKKGRCPNCGQKIYFSNCLTTEETSTIRYTPEWNFFFESSSCLTKVSFKSLRGAFESWALDQCMHAATVMSSLVSPATYEQMMKMLAKGKPGRREDKGDEDLLAQG